MIKEFEPGTIFRTAQDEECKPVVSSVDEGRKITSHAVGILTKMEDWNLRMKEFFGRPLQLKP